MMTGPYDPVVYVIRDPKVPDLRCSRPLCSSQSTGGTPHASPKGKHVKVREVPVPATRSYEQGGARSLRTQQRARHPPTADDVPDQALRGAATVLITNG